MPFTENDACVDDVGVPQPIYVRTNVRTDERMNG